METPAADSLRGNRSFHRLWAAITISSCGTHFGAMAIAFVAALTFDATPLELGVLGAASTLPVLLLGLQSGVWVDRFRRKHVLLAGDAFRCALALLAVVLLLGGWMSLPLLFAFALLIACANAPYEVAVQAYLPGLVKGRAAFKANARLETSRSTTNLAAPALAGTLIALIQAPLVLLCNGLSFAVSFLLIRGIRVEEAAPASARSSTWAQVKGGLLFVRDHDLLGPLALCSAVMNFFRIMFWSFMVVYQLEVLKLSPSEIGIVNGLGSIGMILASLVAPLLLSRTGIRTTLVSGALLSTLPLLGLCAFRSDPLIVLLVAVQALHGFGWVLYNSTQVAFRQMVTPALMRGRMNATMRFCEWAATPLASVAGGALAVAIGMRPALLVAAALGVPACLALRSLRTPDEQDAGHRAIPEARTRFGAREEDRAFESTGR